MGNLKIGDVVEYERFNAFNGWETVQRTIHKITKYSVFLADDVISIGSIKRLNKK